MTQQEHDRLLSDEQLDDKTNYADEESLVVCEVCKELVDPLDLNTDEHLHCLCGCGKVLDSSDGQEMLSGYSATCLGDLP